ncbi:ABC transporter ATP-binding protein [Lapidilactobacillus mulanensis]|uniref:ABC transporter ATP-binding protein n=1 Tax=Lapidilactobacillus mulanensis TaxID=2485999 RepID=A0ABW4DQT6_9LACO|nr:ATP-binding cassette domain-containing protein [Lapidilactobacillus mulanensis]
MSKTSAEILKLENVVTYVNRHTPNENMILRHLDLTIHRGDFITVLGTNGAGKSTLFNVIAGTLPLDEGRIQHLGHDLNKVSPERRANFIARVFQDPKLGTAPRMTVSENLLLASKRGQRRTLRPRELKQHQAAFRETLATMGDGLEDHLDTATENLSGGQRQALSFLMATQQRPDLLLLDEHTAALDPKTSEQLMKQTNETITKQQLTCLMITHHLDDALKYGNRLIVLNAGVITLDVSGAEKQALTKTKLLEFFGNIE